MKKSLVKKILLSTVIILILILMLIISLTGCDKKDNKSELPKDIIMNNNKEDVYQVDNNFDNVYYSDLFEFVLDRDKEAIILGFSEKGKEEYAGNLYEAFQSENYNKVAPKEHFEIPEKILLDNVPINVSRVANNAFEKYKFTGVLTLPKGIKAIGGSAFTYSIFSNNFDYPELEYIGPFALTASEFVGPFVCKNIKVIGDNALTYSKFDGQLDLPDVEVLNGLSRSKFTKSLNLPNVRFIGPNSLQYSEFTDDFYAPKVEDIRAGALMYSKFTKKAIAPKVKTVDKNAFLWSDFKEYDMNGWKGYVDKWSKDFQVEEIEDIKKNNIGHKKENRQSFNEDFKKIEYNKKEY